ncbi:class I SAM-dependent DNA methyltransferase [Spiractinospora alimapuensis]|uniref:class I SAM-dependent DNA methyltransferase n=1 Tax=Spiractinospora alimapuensis TaxID=2820884 RepID=UPI001F3D6379|nr:class I SAM-dependent methyltransferase [Spiractinospora alimapuensis]
MDVNNEQLRRVYKLSGPDEARDIYDEWAASYNEDLRDMGYVGPRVAAQRLAELATPGSTVVDTGCGTGLVGAALLELKADLILDGVDISPGMLEEARGTGAYRNLVAADLTQPLQVPDNSYDAAICVGTFTDGHLGPAGFDDLVRVVRPGGIIVATVQSQVWEAEGFRHHLEEMTRAGTATLREANERPYHEITCRLCVLDVP